MTNEIIKSDVIVEKLNGVCVELINLINAWDGVCVELINLINAWDSDGHGQDIYELFCAHNLGDWLINAWESGLAGVQCVTATPSKAHAGDNDLSGTK